MVSPVSNNISIGVSPIASSLQAPTSQANVHTQTVSLQSNETIKAETSTVIASQSATSIGGGRRDGVQLNPSRCEKDFEGKPHDDDDEENESNDLKDGSKEDKNKLDLRI